MYKTPFIIGTAGHIDHGKTALIKALTGIDTDRLKEEKERGMSIDLGFAYFDLPNGQRVGIVDCPGHARLVKNMLAGATGIDLVVFVVAADDGIMPQTREHLEIMHLLRIQKGIFVITKTDLVDENRIEEVRRSLNALVENTCLRNSPIIRFSAVTSSGVNEIKEKIWDIAKEITLKSEGGYFRLPVDRSFTIRGFGSVVTGTVASGRARRGEDVLIFPRGIKVRVRGIESHNRSVDEIMAGQRGAVNLAGIPYRDVQRGDILTSQGLNRGAALFDVSLEFLKSMERPIKNYTELKLHCLTCETLARVILVGREEAGAGESVYGQLKLKKPLLMLRGDRFILRDSSVNRTIGGGKVLLPFALRRRKGSAEAYLKEYQVLEGADHNKLLIMLLSRKETFAMETREIGLMLNLKREEVFSLIEAEDDVTTLGSYCALKARISEIKERLIKSMERYHRERPEDVGVGEDYLFRAMGNIVPVPLLHQIIEGTVQEGRMIKAGRLFHLPDHRPALTGKDKEVEKAIIDLFASKRFAPPKEDELPQHIPHKREDIERVFHLLLKNGIIIRVEKDTYLLKEILEDARRLLVNGIAQKGRIMLGEFRDILGCGRKMAVSILEFFDRERFTLRQGDFRVLRKKVEG